MSDNNSGIKITHYEDEFVETRNKSRCWKINKPNTYYEDLMKYPEMIMQYLSPEFMDKTLLAYEDPDSVDGVESLSYYHELTQFMNKRASALNYALSFLQPSKAKLSGRCENCNTCKEGVDGADESKIALIKDGSPLMLLTSDLFGFSVAGGKIKDKMYPYGMYFNQAIRIDDNIDKDNQKDNQKQRQEMLTFIGRCIYDTRTLGGAFLWPVDAEWRNNNWNIKSKNSNYNLKRGMGSYIEDRVDLTLLEIKHFYEFFDEKKGFDEEEYKEEYKGDIILSYSDSDKIVEWLGLFGSFEKYVEFFMFHPFVVKKDGSYYPIDVFNSKIPEEVDKIGKTDGIKMEERKPCLRVIEKAPKTKEIQQCNDCNKLKRMLNNVRLLTLARSRMMTAFIKCPNENDWEQYNPKWTVNDLVKHKIAPPSVS